MCKRTAVGVLALTVGLALVSGIAWGAVLCRTTQPLDGRTARVGESTLGDLVADGARASMKAELALVQASHLREELVPAGDVTDECLDGLLVYPNEPIVLVELSGQQVLAALERSLSVLPQPSPAFLQVSGLTVTFRSDGAPGQRVASVTVGNGPLAPAKSYKVALPSSLAKGAMGYFRVFGQLEQKQVGPSVRTAVADYARAQRTLTIAAGQRLRDLASR